MEDRGYGECYCGSLYGDEICEPCKTERWDLIAGADHLWERIETLEADSRAAKPVTCCACGQVTHYIPDTKGEG